MLVLLGSAALNHYKFVRTPVDLDLLGTYEDIEQHIAKIRLTGEKIFAQYPTDSGNKIVLKTEKRIYEFEICWDNSNSAELFQMCLNESHSDLHEGQFIVPSLNILYALKMSHRYRKDSPHFLKTMEDIWTMRGMGAKMVPEYAEWFKWRECDTYQNTLPKLNQSKKDFFDNSNSIYSVDHDDIHLAVKHLDTPAYEKFKPDSAEVMTSKEMFFACDRQVQLYAALEEVMVLSIERSILPFPNVDKRWAFDMAHKKLASSISSGWFREFVWEEYNTVQKMYNDKYVDKFYEALYSGKIRKFGSDEIYMKEAA